MTRLLMVSDIHMNNRLPHSKPGPAGLSDRLQDQLGLWQRIHEIAKKKRVVATVVLGDLFDKSLVDAITLTYTVEAIAASPVPLYILPGNHDAVSTKGGRFTVEAFGKMGNDRIEYMKTGKCYSFGDTNVVFWPVEYCPQERAREWLSNIRASMDSSKTNINLMHHSILGCTHIGWTCDDGLTPEEACEGFDWTFSGHFHDAQSFGPADRGMYLGAPLHLRFEDEGRRAGFWIVDIPGDGTIKRSFVDGECPKFHTCEWLGDPPTKLATAIPGDYIRITVEATHADWTTTKPDVVAYVAKLCEEGYRASYKHKPLYHHTVRIESEKRGERFAAAVTPEAATDAYVEAVDVDKTGLSEKQLKRIGREAIENARKAAGSWASSSS